MITQIRRLPKIKSKEIRIDLGCGDKIKKGCIGMDIRDCKQEILWDARDGIPFEDNSVDYIFSSHFLEHLDNGECEDVLREIYRVLKPGGTTEHILPHQEDPTAFYFDHKTFWNEFRVNTLPGVPGLEGFKIIKNETKQDYTFRGYLGDKFIERPLLELTFILKK